MNLDKLNRILYYVLPVVIIPYGFHYLLQEGEWIRTPIVLIGVLAWINIHRKFQKQQLSNSQNNSSE